MKTIKGLSLIICFFLLISAGVKANPGSDTIKDNIFTAIRSIDYTSINILLAEGIDIDTVDKQGNTPLMAAAEIGNPRILDIILSHNPDINKQNKSGESALLIAAKSGQLHIVKKLVSYGADTSTRNKNGDNALTLASKFAHGQIVDFFTKVRTQPKLAK